MLVRAFALFAGLMAGTSVFAQAAPSVTTNFVEGTHYFKIVPAQASAAPTGKVEVVEVFSYACVHCATFEPHVANWKKTMPAEASFSYMPAVFNPTWEAFARAYYASEVLGIQKQAHEAMFKAVHEERRPFRSVEDLAKFYTAYGKTEQQVLDAMKSFGVEMKMNRSLQQVPKYGVDGTPTLVVAGKYRVTGTSAGSLERVFQVVDFLVKKEAAERKAASAPTPVEKPVAKPAPKA